MNRRSALLVVTAVAVLAALAGWLAGRSIDSPDEAARNAEPPPASRITVPVERRTLSQNVVFRGDVELADSIEIKVDPAIAGGGPAIVTGVPVAEGARLEEGTVLLEVSERPVVLLAGELPMFRTLSVGSTGDDVAQFEASLARLGIDPGPQDGRFDAATEAAVRVWYTQLGYAPIAPSAAEQERLRTAQATFDAAQRALDAAAAGPSAAERLRLQGSVDDAIAAADNARANGADPGEIARLDREIAIAIAVRDAALAVDTSGLRQGRDEAQAELTKVREQTGVRVPAAEVVFVASMPRTLDALAVSRGNTVSTTAVATISNAAVRIRSAVSAEDRPLLKVGDTVRIEEEGLGIDVEGTITELADKTGGTGVAAGKYAVRIEPASFDPALLGVNVRLTVPVQSTAGEVLAVPLAAVFATADGSARVEVEDDPQQPTRLVTVKTGLSASGFVEISPIESGALDEGTRVVVGQDGAGDEGRGEEPAGENGDDPDSPADADADAEEGAARGDG